MRENIEPELFYQRNFIEIRPDDKIYKYMPLKYLINILTNNHLRIYQTETWEDVYENYFLKQKFVTEQGKQVSTSEILPRCYGQSWTLEQESDAMWRIYSLDKLSIKIKTTVKKLMDAYYTDDKCMATTFIGRVDYLEQSQIENQYANLNIEANQYTRDCRLIPST